MSQGSSHSGSEMRNMADGGERKRNCFARYPIACCVFLTTTLVLSLLVSALSAGLYVTLVEPAVDKAVASNVVLTPGSAGLSQFMSSSAPLFSYYYMYDITNAAGVLTGDTPMLNEIGPFVYKENRTKYEASWEDDSGGNTTQDVLVYSMMINYTWDEALSGARDPAQTKVTTINVPLVGVLLQMEKLEDSMKDKNAVEREAIKLLLEAIDELISKAVSGEGLFITRSVQDLLWGYQDNLLSDIKTLQDDFNKVPFHKPIDLVDQTYFGFGNLSSVETPNRVYTGANDTRLVATFKQWDGHYNMSGWGTPYAQEIRGTGGFLFHPGVTREENLTSFINELYRSGYFSYQEDISVSGVLLYKFGLPGDELLNTTQDPGFYANGPSGVLNLTAVVPSNVPLFASKPHFLDADIGYLDNVTGLKPDRALHDSYLAAEPLTGAVLDAAKRIQVNLRLTKYANLPQLSNVKDVTMLPIYWVAQTGTITPALADEFKAAVYSVEDGIKGGMWALTGLAGLVAVVCLLCLVGVILQRFKRSNHGNSRTRQHAVNHDESSPLLTQAFERTDI